MNEQKEEITNKKMIPSIMDDNHSFKIKNKHELVQELIQRSFFKDNEKYLLNIGSTCSSAYLLFMLKGDCKKDNSDSFSFTHI